MEKKRDSALKFVVCIKNDNNPASLELLKIYRKMPDPNAQKDGDIRVIDESGEDYLYPAEYFIPIEVPADLEKAIMHAAH